MFERGRGIGNPLVSWGGFITLLPAWSDDPLQPGDPRGSHGRSPPLFRQRITIDFIVSKEVHSRVWFAWDSVFSHKLYASWVTRWHRYDEVMYISCEIRALIVYRHKTFSANTRTEMSSFGRNFHHWQHWKLPFWHFRCCHRSKFRQNCDNSILCEHVIITTDWQLSIEVMQVAYVQPCILT